MKNLNFKMKNFPKKASRLSPLASRPSWTLRAGFTLVELLVSIALFAILVSIAAGGFVNALRTERQAAAMMAAQSNVSIAFEQMTRETRTGYLFCHDAGSSVPSAACNACTIDVITHVWTCPNTLEYYNANGEKVDYTLDVNGVINRAVNGGPAQAITGDNVSIRYLNFTIYGNIEGDHWNPRVTISAGVAPHDSTINWNITNLETSISARSIDCTQGASPSC
jgi:prepilin-type N-terminal cleavage/methylation domain-containing protein